MAELFLHINVSLDGFIEDASGEIDWHFSDDEFEAYLADLLQSIDGMFFGRIAHQLLAGFWPGAAELPGVSEHHLTMTALMNRLPKYVPTRGEYSTTWENSHVLEGDVAAQVHRLKEEAGRDLALFAGGATARSFLAAYLLDEVRLIVNPVVLGSGRRLFERGMDRREMQLLGSRTFASGATVLRYRPRPLSR